MSARSAFLSRTLGVVAAGLALAPLATKAQQGAVDPTLARIRAEGLERSTAPSLFLTLTDGIGARLTGAPSHLRAAQWARDRFAEWGLTQARLEPFEFGAGWELVHVSAAMTEPRYFPLIAYPEAWTSSTAGALNGRVVYLGDKTSAQVTAMGPALKGAIVLTHPPVTTFVDRDRPQPGLAAAPVATGNPSLPQARASIPAQTLASLLRQFGAGVAIRPSTYTDGTVGVLGNRNTPRDAVPTIVIGTEQYNMMARLAAAGQPVSMAVESRTRHHETDRHSYNVIAEIAGTDPAVRDEYVLIGAHLDSWHAANGATDNADGVVAVMEAMRILRAIGAAPRRTIRVALWSGEEQGLLGARAYLAQHLSTPDAQAKLQVYLNDDPGSGRTLGFYLENNQGAKAIFDRWLAPLGDLGTTMNVIEGIGSTDHVPFVQAGMPAFNAIKDFEAYDVRTRHTNADFPERMSEDELKQQAVVMATFAWQAAMMTERIPRLPPRVNARAATSAAARPARAPPLPADVLDVADGDAATSLVHSCVEALSHVNTEVLTLARPAPTMEGSWRSRTNSRFASRPARRRRFGGRPAEPVWICRPTSWRARCRHRPSRSRS